MLGVDSLGDIFPHLTDVITNGDDADVENVIDSLYGYGMLHGRQLQAKVEQSPFYTKHYKKLTVKQQQQMRTGRGSPEDSSYDDESSELEVEKKPAPSGRGKHLQKKANTSNNRSTLFAPLVANSGRAYIGVSVVSSGRAGGNGTPVNGAVGKKGPALAAHKVGTFDAYIQVGSRKVMIGQYPTIDDAAQAHDRALIRANGPTACTQPGLLNYPLSFYSGDSLSKFSAFDTVLKKQLFGSDWSGPKPCDFGFLMTQHNAGGTKRGLETVLHSSARKKRVKGQYRERSDSEDDSLGDSYSRGKGKKLLYGNYYVLENGDRVYYKPAGSAASRSSRGMSVDTAEEPYFRSSSPSGPRPPPPVRKADDPNFPKAGEVLMLMNGDKERTQGRPAYERAIMLGRSSNGGWLELGLTDHTTRKQRGEQTTMMGTCGAQMKFMRVPPEAVSAEDEALREHFRAQGYLRESNFNVNGSSETGTAAQVVIASQRRRSINNNDGDSLSQSSAAALPSAVMEALKQPANIAAFTAHYSYVPPPIPDWEAVGEDDEEDPISLYELADYSLTAKATRRSSPEPSKQMPCTSPVWQEYVQSGDTLHKARPSRFIGSTHGTAVIADRTGKDRPANFQAYTSTTFGHKMTDLPASVCYCLPQELALLRAILDASPGKGPEEANGHCDVQTPGSSQDSFCESDAQFRNSATVANGSCSHTVFPQPAWLLSLLHPENAEMAMMLAAVRQSLADLLLSCINPSAQPESSNGVVAPTTAATAPFSLAAKLLGEQAFEGVSEVSEDEIPNNSSLNGSRGAPRRFAFALPASNKMLMGDLGISAAVVAAGLQWVGPESQQGAVMVGYFSSALEAAIVREQVLGLTKSAFGVTSSYGVDAPSNFKAAEWAELRRVGKLYARFVRKNCLP